MLVLRMRRFVVIYRPGRAGKYFGVAQTGKMVAMPPTARERPGEGTTIGIIESGASDWASLTGVDGCLRSMRS
jgi:hypothetical protein